MAAGNVISRAVVYKDDHNCISTVIHTQTQYNSKNMFMSSYFFLFDWHEKERQLCKKHTEWIISVSANI